MNRKRFGILIFTIFCGTDLLTNPVIAACSANNSNEKKIGELYNYILLCGLSINERARCLLLYGFAVLLYVHATISNALGSLTPHTWRNVGDHITGEAIIIIIQYCYYHLCAKPLYAEYTKPT